MALIKRLDWDTNHYEMICGKCESYKNVPIISNNDVIDYDMISFFGNFKFALEGCGTLVKVADHVTYEVPVTRGSSEVSRLTYFENSGEIENCAHVFADFSDSRFYQDARFDKKKVREMYVNWIRNSVNRENKTSLLFIDATSLELIGLIVFRITDVMRLELINVNSIYRGKGYGKEMLSIFDNIVYNKDFTSYYVGTQMANSGANRLYTAMGGKRKEEIAIHHWFKK